MFKIVVEADGKITEEVKELECVLNPLQLGRKVASHYVEETPAGRIVYRLWQMPEGDELAAFIKAPLGISRVVTMVGRISILPVVEAEAAAVA